MRSPERRARRIEADRADLIAAAERVFARVGYTAASVRDIAREANFSVGGVYKLVESKDDLYVAVIARVWAEYQAALAPALAAGGFEDRLRGVTRTWLAFFAARRAFMSVLMSEKASWTPAFHERVDRLVQKHRRARRRQIVELMTQGITERRIRFRDADMLASAYLGLVSQCNLDALSDTKRRQPNPDDLVSLFMNGACTPAA